jgi:hypothetical protein
MRPSAKRMDFDRVPKNIYGISSKTPKAGTSMKKIPKLDLN